MARSRRIKRSRTPWTEDQVETLRINFANWPTYLVANVCGHTESSTSQKARQLDLKKSPEYLDLELRLDGLPRSGQREPADPGIAVYWRDHTVDGWPQRCMAIDRYDRVADNLAAVAATLEAMRAIERHGGAEILNRAFTGFAALPAPGGTAHWRDVLDASDPEGSYRRLRGIHHPDRGGDADEFRAVQHAWDAYQLEQRP